MISSVFAICLFLYALERSEMSFSVVSTPISSLISVSSSWFSRGWSIFLPMLSTEESEELILSRVFPSRSLKKPAVLVKIPITDSRPLTYLDGKFRRYWEGFQEDFGRGDKRQR